ncbi:NAD(P)H-dependent oxidoreductase subunit E [Clostridium gasigenes]|uniref:NADH-quinone oxidoreductase subunit NuoE family protein n=1 Tax=Clostridium gasigenes TaxID=94869 RepID=UPI001629BC1E|nr:NAD(P)H-dependent oxidoreductase subunit E [Clostridium gasigenes]MBB6623612.1 NAD(P)H-dependent oxidoreductase subunit E [Clostridium gasigenes]MBU3087587.1 NAD(P)H-dependent oxidoreductase subunit E [Clostridium gasigenes]
MCSKCSDYLKFKVLDDYINKQSNTEGCLITVLHKAQEIHGYLGEEVQQFISNKLNIPISKIYGVITFYSYFTIEPKGKYVISVCTGTACFVRGSNDILEGFKKRLNINDGETTTDGLYTLDTLRCVGACGLAPVVTINNKIYGKFDSNEIEKVLNEFKE